jgi:hypothetical protein
VNRRSLLSLALVPVVPVPAPKIADMARRLARDYAMTPEPLRSHIYGGGVTWIDCPSTVTNRRIG